MQNHSVDELVTELLVIKDIYICGRMNQAICNTVNEAGTNVHCSQDNWKKYEKLSAAYRDDSVCELAIRKETIDDHIEENGLVAVDPILNTTYDEFDEELINDMMRDYYGSKDSIAFAKAYNHCSEDFNALICEFILD